MEFNIGDKVNFGAYSWFDNNDIWTITNKEKCDKYLGGIQYQLEDDKGNSVIAFSDEVRLAKS